MFQEYVLIVPEEIVEVFVIVFKALRQASLFVKLAFGAGYIVIIFSKESLHPNKVSTTNFTV